jgi:beta-farnesene synthase
MQLTLELMARKYLMKPLYSLEATLTSLESKLADEVSLSLQTPLFPRVKILETRNYIPIYEMEPSRNEAMLEFAKLNFNLLQILYCEELKTVTA